MAKQQLWIVITYPEVKASFAAWPRIGPLLAKQTDDVYRYAVLLAAIVI
jgi:hypothetical protein